ncbi:MAG: nicotinamide mononucleotide transporter [Bacteroidales bacterium]|nr:nicotinamide mononucleotide transporter [Bacteroidales bacterium]
MEIITLITGVIYIILEIRQKNAMWVLGIFTSSAAIIVFFRQGLYASFGLNIYYLITSFIGLWHWRRDKKKLDEEHSIHLNRLTRKTVITSAIAAITGIIALSYGMDLMAELGFKENPMSVLDASVAVLSVIATWWLVRSYIQQWWLWIAADTLSTILCATQGMWWMALLYLLYTASALIGLRHWKKNGAIISENE